MTDTTPHDGNTSPLETMDPSVPHPPRRRRGRRAALVGVGSLAVIGLGTAALAGRDWSGGSAGPTTAKPGPTVAITRTDLSVSLRLDGALAYAGAAVVYAPGRTQDPRSGGKDGTDGKDGTNDRDGKGEKDGKGNADPPDTPTGPGTLTALPIPGKQVQRGDPLYAVDGAPIPLLYGDAPLWRPLHAGMSDGADVRLLESNLSALGFAGPLRVDDRFTDGTAEAIKRWQKALHLPETGRILPSDVSIQPDAVRVGAVKAALGAPAQGEIAAVTSTRRVVTVELPVDRQTLVHDGVKVTVVLPGDRSTDGTVSKVGTVLSAKPEDKDGGGGGGRGGSTDPKLPIEIALDRPQDAGVLDGAPVTVRITTETRPQVLAVPVNALVALPDGAGYGLELVGADGVLRTVPIRTGLYAGDRVEVSGEGLAAGTKVRVPVS
ncbi:peptidoglycan-binding protein [Embleya sp. NPDC001921]